MLWISLPKYTTVGPRLREELGEPLGVAFVRQPLVGVSGIRRIAPRLLEQPRERLVARQGTELVDVDARRNLVHAVDVADHVLEHLADVRGADEDRLRARERFATPRRELRVAAHRVLELGAVRLDDVARAGRSRHRPPEQDVVREDDVGRQVLAQRRRVELDVALALRPASDPEAVAPRAPRSGRGRRPAAGRRCRGARAPRSPGRRARDAAPGRTAPRRDPRGSIRGRARACRRSSPFRPADTRAREGFSGEVEVERVEQLDRRVGRVDGDVGRHVEERFRVVEDDLDARADQVVGRALRARGGDRQHADDDVLLPDDVGKTLVRGHLDVADPTADFLRVGVEDRGDVDAVLREDRAAGDRLAEAAGPDQRDVVLALRPQDLADLAEQRVDVVADAALAELAEAGQVPADLGGVDVRVVGDLLRGDALLPHLLGLRQDLEIAGESRRDTHGQPFGQAGSLYRRL